jgi:hypothetical protein
LAQVIPASQSEPQQDDRRTSGPGQPDDLAEIEIECYDNPPVLGRSSENLVIGQICETNFASVNGVMPLDRNQSAIAGGRFMSRRKRIRKVYAETISSRVSHAA